MDFYLWPLIALAVLAALAYFYSGALVTSEDGGGTEIDAARKKSSGVLRKDRSPSALIAAEWLNELLIWVRINPGLAQRFHQLLVRSLNETVRKMQKSSPTALDSRTGPGLSSQSPWEIHFEVPKVAAHPITAHPLDTPSSSPSHAPMVENVRAEMSPANGHLTVNAHLDAPFGVDVGLIASLHHKMERMEVQIRHLRGDLDARLACIADEIFFMACFCSRPEMNVRIVRPSHGTDSTPLVPNEELEEAVRRCLTSVVLNFPLGELLYPPTLAGGGGAGSGRSSLLLPPGANLFNDFDDKRVSYASPAATTPLPPNRLNMKLVKLEFTGDGVVKEAYASVELDEPSQRFISGRTTPWGGEGGARGGRRVVVWDETFEFQLTPGSRELLFEVYDESLPDEAAADGVKLRPPDARRRRSPQPRTQPPTIAQNGTSPSATTRKNRFLGAAVLGLDELPGSQVASNSAVSHRLPLQGRSPLIGRGVNDEAGTQTTDGVLVIECRFWCSRQVSGIGVAGSPKFPLQPGTSEFENYQRGASPDNTASQTVAKTQSYTKGLSNLDHERPGRSGAISSLLSAESLPRGGDSTDRSSPSTRPTVIVNEPQQPYDNLLDGEKAAVDRTSAPSHHSFHQLIQHEQRHYEQKGFLDRLLRRPEEVDAEIQRSEVGVGSEQQQHQQRKMSAERREQMWRMHESGPAEISGEEGTGPTWHDQHRVDREIALKETLRQQRTSSPKEPLDVDWGHHATPAQERQSRKRERSFFDELKEKLARGSTRLRNFSGSGGGRGKRTRSLDQHSAASDAELEEAVVSVPPSRDPSQVRPHGGEGSTAKRWQPGADVSPSVLVLELPVAEGEARRDRERGSPTNIVYRYYQIPASIALEPATTRLVKSGKKLHLHNNHTFVAVKPKGRITCAVCTRKIVGAFTRQAYQCRDCMKVTHKGCHQYTYAACPNSQIHYLPIVQDVNWRDFLRKYQMEEFISVEGV